MPRLKLHGYSLNVASDDFVFSGSVEILLRIFGLLGLCLVCVRYGRVEPGLACDGSHVVTSYLYGLSAMFCVTVLADLALVLVSMRGTIVDDAPRRHIPALLQARAAIQVLEWAWNIIGCVWVLQRVCGCSDHAHWVVYRILAGTWVMAALEGLLILVGFGLRRDEHQAVITKHDWEQRWRCLCGCLSSGDNNSVFSTLASMCVNLFKKEELVGSDILAGLMLVYHRQRHTRLGLDVVDAANIDGRLRPRCRYTPTEPRGWMTFQQMAHYMKYALGSYGWPYFIGLNNPIVASCQLIPRLSVRSYSQVHKDNMFCANTTAFIIQTGVAIEDIICATYHNEIYSIPFYVSVDRETQSVVISIRGTLSVEDLLTDLVVERAEIDVPGVEGGCYVHRGMLQSALYIKARLEQIDMLHEAFKKYSVSGLVITGHSLGAGVAAILAILLRPTYPDVTCYAFAPPGELISENMIPYTKSFICSVVLGYDVVPRLGLLELKKLKINILTAIQRCKLPKHQLIASGIWQRIFGEHLHDEQLLDCGSDTHGHTDWLQALLEEELQEQGALLATYLPLLPPGQILHVLEQIPTHRSRRPKQYYAEWTDASTFQEIILSRRMIAHHFPDTLLEALTQIANPDEVVHAETKKTS